MKIISPVIISFFILSCIVMSNKPDKLIKSTVRFNESTGFMTTYQIYNFTQTTVNDSSYVLNYYCEIKNMHDTNKKFIRDYTFELVPDTDIIYQKMIFKNSTASTLWLLQSKKYIINDKNYEVFKFGVDVTAENFCVNYSYIFWSPDFGILLWGNHTQVCSDCGGSRILIDPPEKDDTIAARMLVDNVSHDIDFFMYKGAAENRERKRRNPDIQYPCFNYPGMADDTGKITTIKKFISDAIIYPEKAKDSCVYGMVRVNMKLDTAGNIINKTIGISEKDFLVYTPLFENECKRVLENIPGLAPLTFAGRKVLTNYSFLFEIKLPNPGRCEEILNRRKKEQLKRDKEQEELKYDNVFLITEQMPEFPGGKDSLKNYLMRQIKYPELAKTERDSGYIYLTLLIDKDGSIKNVEILRAFESKHKEEFIKEAIRVVQNMPKWNPGQQRGHRVKVQYNLPVKFRI